MAEVVHISVYIARPPEDVYAFASNPRNLPLWAEGLAQGKVTEAGPWWRIETPSGAARVRFVEPNAFGVMDHDVELATGTVFHNPMRVLPNEAGSEFVFSLMRPPGMTDEQYAVDRRAVEHDLQRLKEYLESG
ncbi:SRPBCC family protein [Thioalkalivibrio sp. ALJ7]|uniref:SRPBCC family protein n=1 Tax=Thioalkalivibrio sp. ALJ7 TaxID=1158756 RepID=UPI00035FF1F8|nr:SRPBCC family protein [Thioalkalivibrio sp. ALJ7]